MYSRLICVQFTECHFSRHNSLYYTDIPMSLKSFYQLDVTATSVKYTFTGRWRVNEIAVFSFQTNLFTSIWKTFHTFSHHTSADLGNNVWKHITSVSYAMLKTFIYLFMFQFGFINVRPLSPVVTSLPFYPGRKARTKQFCRGTTSLVVIVSCTQSALLKR